MGSKLKKALPIIAGVGLLAATGGTGGAFMGALKSAGMKKFLLSQAITAGLSKATTGKIDPKAQLMAGIMSGAALGLGGGKSALQNKALQSAAASGGGASPMFIHPGSGSSFLASQAGQNAMQGVMQNATFAERLGHAGITASQGLNQALFSRPETLGQFAKSAAAYGAPIALASALDTPKVPGRDTKMDDQTQAQYDMIRRMGQGLYSDADINTYAGPLLAQMGGSYKPVSGTDAGGFYQPMFPGTNYTDLNRFIRPGQNYLTRERNPYNPYVSEGGRIGYADGGDIVADDNLTNYLLGQQSLSETPTPDSFSDEMMEFSDKTSEANKMAEEELMEEYERLLEEGRMPEDTDLDSLFGMNTGGRIEMGLGGMLSKMFGGGDKANASEANLEYEGWKRMFEKSPDAASMHPDHEEFLQLYSTDREGMQMGGSVPQTQNIPQGMQLDGRGGGFIPMGAQEKHDDVPAMLAKNEFVMTSDAVRAAGGGNINKGAQKMYDLMNSLESKV